MINKIKIDVFKAKLLDKVKPLDKASKTPTDTMSYTNFRDIERIYQVHYILLKHLGYPTLVFMCSGDHFYFEYVSDRPELKCNDIKSEVLSISLVRTLDYIHLGDLISATICDLNDKIKAKRKLEENISAARIIYEK